MADRVLKIDNGNSEEAVLQLLNIGDGRARMMARLLASGSVDAMQKWILQELNNHDSRNTRNDVLQCLIMTFAGVLGSLAADWGDNPEQFAAVLAEEFTKSITDHARNTAPLLNGGGA